MKRFAFVIFALLMCMNVCAQITVKSRVKDSTNGEQLPYVNIYVGKDRGTLTNYDGDFTIVVDSENTMLRISCIGYQTINIMASEVGEELKMIPMEHSMRELQVRAWPGFLEKVAKKLNKEYGKKNGKKSQYFMRMTTSLGRRDLTEAFVEANSAINLRNLTMIKGRHGQVTHEGLTAPTVGDMNFHHLMEIAPLIRDVVFWDRLITPLSKNATTKYLMNNYDITGEGLIDTDGKSIYRIKLKTRDINEALKNTEQKEKNAFTEAVRMLLSKRKRAILEGTLYVDAQTLQPLRFDGSIENLSLQIAEGLKKTEVGISLTLHVNYRNDKNFTEVSDIAVKMKNGDFACQALLFNVENMNLGLKAKKKNRAKENMLESIESVGFDETLWANSNIIQRTSEEERLAGLENQSEIITDSIAVPRTKRERLIDRLTRFSQSIPQEKVYLHMDNTSYFLGDTIWYAIYTRQTNNDLPSNISHLAYVELYNQDGYMVERQLVDIRNGRGHGNFALSKEMFGGYYELRAYTRWQLNWGVYEHKHSRISSEWFLNEELEQKHFRDYDKLYSRVFPVYDAPTKEGEYTENMTMRPMRRYFRKDPDKPQLEMKLYPEGGNLVEGMPCRVAYEVTWEDGEDASEGVLDLGDTESHEIAKDVKQQISEHKKLVDKEMKSATKQAKKKKNEKDAVAPSTPIKPVDAEWVKNRGVFTITPHKGMNRTITYIDRNGNKATEKLPEVEAEGTCLKVEQTDTTWMFDITLSPGMQKDSLGITIMNEGNVQKVMVLDSLHADNLHTIITLHKNELKEGVNQVTIFDVEGMVWADRLFFNMLPGNHSITSSHDNENVTVCLLDSVAGQQESTPLSKQSYFNAYQPIRLSVESAPNATLSMSVRDALHSDRLYDNATMRTEMLLASEVKGFIPNAQWYFEKDDEEHRQALDLLLMIQGWRRFNWQHMAVPKTWEITQTAESTPVITGRIYKTADWAFHSYTNFDYAAQARNTGVFNRDAPYGVLYEGATDDLIGKTTRQDVTSGELALNNISNSGVNSIEGASASDGETGNVSNTPDTDNTSENVLERTDKKTKRGKAVTLHAELVSIDGKETRVTEQITRDGRFRILLPGYYGNAIFFLSASDTTKWKKKSKYAWIQTYSPDEVPEYTVHVDFPYPRFVKPYNFYQQHVMESSDSIMGSMLLDDDAHQMREVKVRGRRGGLRKFSDSIPAFTIDAYQAYNEAIDGGMYVATPEMIVRNYLGDYGMEFPYVTKNCNGSTRTISNIFLRFGYDITRRAVNNLTMDIDSVYLRGNLASFAPYSDCGEALRFLSVEETAKYYNQQAIDKYVIYTDYQPRLEGSNRYYGSNLPRVDIAIYPYSDDSQRYIYRDRRYVLDGYAYPDNFYHPNYKNRKLDEKPKDYRRTLYWNPDLKLDKEGKAVIKFYNNGKQGNISVSAEGMTSDGKILGN